MDILRLLSLTEGSLCGKGHLLTVHITGNIIASYHIRGEPLPLLLRYQNMEAVMWAHMGSLTLGFFDSQPATWMFTSSAWSTSLASVEWIIQKRGGGFIWRPRSLMRSSMSQVRHCPGDSLPRLPLINTSYENALYTRISKYSNVMWSLNQPADLGVLTAWSPFSSHHAWDRTANWSKC